MNHQKMLLCTTLNLFFHCFYFVRGTEITVESDTVTIDKSLGLAIAIPVLICHAKHTVYKEVTWYKDGVVVKKGTSDFWSHVLPLESLINSSLPSVEFDNPFKLQGYYWCETDNTSRSDIHDYLFRIQEIDTFVGRFIATKDSLGDSEDLSLPEKITWKKQIYEEEMQTELFGFLPSPNVYVTDIKVVPNGLDVRFFVYSRSHIDPRKPIDDKLMADEDSRLYIQEHLLNEISAVDPIMYLTFRNWTDLLGIEVKNIDLRSTLGCYSKKDPMESSEHGEVIWPYARIGEVVIPDVACSTKHDLAVTRLCTGSFVMGAKWGNPSGKCEKPAEGTTLQLKELYDEFGSVDKAETIEKLVKVTSNSSKLGVTGLHIAIDILNELSRRPKLDKKEISGILSVIDNIVETNKTELAAAKNIIYLTSRILRIFDNLLDQATREHKEIQVSKQHLMVDTKYTTTDDTNNPILGLAVIIPHLQDSLRGGSVEFMTNNRKLPQHESLAYFSLPQELVLERESEMETPCQVNMVFFKEWYLFQNPKGVLVKRNYKVLPTPVMYVSISGGPAWNLTDPVQLYFKDTLSVPVEDPVCVYYDPLLENETGAWSSEGCEYEGYKNGYYHCQCHHLSIFAVILSQNPDTTPSPKELSLGSSAYVACGVSMLALSLAVVLFVLSKNWRQTVDHSILFNISLCYLVCIIILFVSETRFARKPGCVLMAMVLHYTIFTIFGWLAVQAFVYRLRFAKKTDVSEIPHFMIKTGLTIWGVPIVIIVIMWFSQDYPPSTNENCWLTVSEVSKEALIPLTLLMLVILCIYACATYSLNCHFKKDYLSGDTSYNDIVVKFRVAFVIYLFFVLTWLFGFFALHRRFQFLRILFSICITLTAYYLALFFIFQEVSFWDLCRKCKNNKVEPDETTSVDSKRNSYKSIEDVKKAEKF